MNNFFDAGTLSLVFKVLMLILIGMYTIFVFMIHHHIRSLNKILHINKTAGSPLLQAVSFIYLGAAISLFLIALVIL